MSFRINTNLPAWGALRQLGVTNAELERTLGRLSTGLRINSAADDPAGLVMSEGMRAQIKGIEQAVRNSQDGINMIKTAEGAMEEVQRLLRSIRALAVQSANAAVTDSAQLEANQAQIRNVLESIDRIAGHTSWGQKRLLDGTAGVGAAVLDPSNVAGIFMGGSFNGVSIGTGPVTLQRTTAAAQEVVLNDVTFTTPASDTPGPGTFVINGYTFAADGLTDTVDALVASINAQAQNTGVVATLVGSGPYALELRSVEYGARFPITFVDPFHIFNTATQPPPTTAGRDAVATVQVLDADGDVLSATFTGGRGPRTSGLRLSDDHGNVVTLTPAGNASSDLGSPTLVGQVTVGSMRFQIGPYANQSVAFSLPSMRANQLGDFNGDFLTDIDVTTPEGAERAIRIIDAAIEQVALLRGGVGSFQANFLESTARTLAVAQENVAGSESQIRDADMAATLTDFVRLQILQQSGIAALSHANQQPQNVLRLLQG